MSGQSNETPSGTPSRDEVEAAELLRRFAAQHPHLFNGRMSFLSHSSQHGNASNSGQNNNTTNATQTGVVSSASHATDRIPPLPGANA